jgi:hypothetical protein
MEAYFASPEVRQVYGRLSDNESGSGGSKGTTMTTNEVGPLREPLAVPAQEWALKTTTSFAGPDPPWAVGPSFWDYFHRDGVIAVGWEAIDVNPSRASLNELRQVIERTYPHDAAEPEMRETKPAKAARSIKYFVDLRERDRESGREGDLILICRGYPGNSGQPVHVYGFARVTGPFQSQLSAGWPWRFKHMANIQRVEKALSKADMVAALRKGSLIGTIHKLESGSITEVARRLGVQVEV